MCVCLFFKSFPLWLRFMTKDDVAHASLSKARIESGTVRHVTPETSARRTCAQLTSVPPDR